MDSQKQNCIDPTEHSGVEPAVAIAEPVIKMVEKPPTAASSMSVVKAASEIGSTEDSVGQSDLSVSACASAPAPVAAPSSGYSSSSAAYNAAYLTVDKSADWPKTRRRQIFNVIYFSICAYLSFMLLNRFGGPLMAFSAVFSFVLFVASSVYVVSHRSHVSIDDELPEWSRKLLRATALLLPFAIIGGTAWVVDHDPTAAWPAPSHASSGVVTAAPLDFNNEISLADKLYNDDDYDGAIVHYLNAAQLQPSEHAEERLADSYLRVDGETEEMALTHADKALAINPKNVPALSSKAWALNTLERFKEALPIATYASKVDPSFGESYAAISNAQNGLGDHKAALAADNQHVRIHNDETTAYSMRSDTYKSLGKTKEAKADADMVASLEKKEK